MKEKQALFLTLLYKKHYFTRYSVTSHLIKRQPQPQLSTLNYRLSAIKKNRPARGLVNCQLSK